MWCRFSLEEYVISGYVYGLRTRKYIDSYENVSTLSQYSILCRVVLKNDKILRSPVNTIFYTKKSTYANIFFDC